MPGALLYPLDRSDSTRTRFLPEFKAYLWRRAGIRNRGSASADGAAILSARSVPHGSSYCFGPETGDLFSTSVANCWT